jgi:hypothetical protein
VLQAIREHVEASVEHAEAGYSSAQEEEDTITGELGGALRTRGVQTVNVTDDQIPGTWRWNINYSKFRSKSGEATESIVGADGILEIRVASPEQEQQKTALFQAINTHSKAHSQTYGNRLFKTLDLAIGVRVPAFQFNPVDK